MPVDNSQIEAPITLKPPPASEGASIVASETELDVSGFIASECLLDAPARYVKSKSTLAEALLTDRARAFWMLSCGWVKEEEENPTLYKVPLHAQKAPFGFSLTHCPGKEQYWHSFFFNDVKTSHPDKGVYGSSKFWAYDSKNHQLAVLIQHQFAVHIYDLTSGIKDRIYTHVAEEFGEAVGLAFSDGRVDVLIPRILTSYPTWNFIDFRCTS